MTDDKKLNAALEAGIHDFGHTQVSVEFIVDEGDWAVVNHTTGDFIATSFFNAREALEKAAWLAGGHAEMEKYISEVLKEASIKAKMKPRGHLGRRIYGS